MNVGDMNQAMPVGTTVALLERGTKVMSAIHKRLHYSQKLEFQLLAKVFAEYLPPNYPYVSRNGPQEIMGQDFDGRVDVNPCIRSQHLQPITAHHDGSRAAYDGAV